MTDRDLLAAGRTLYAPVCLIERARTPSSGEFGQILFGRIVEREAALARKVASPQPR
jgi:hypothetical protein